MKSFEKCSTWGGELQIKQVKKLLKGGGNIVSLGVENIVY